MQLRASLSVLTAALLLALHASAQPPSGQTAAPAAANPSPATAPATAPTTAAATEPAPYRIVVPPGFVKITANGRTALAQQADEAWVREVLTQTGPASRPSTMPADLAQQITDKRAELARQASTDLGLPDPGAVEKFIDGQIIPRVQKLQDLRPPIIYMPVTREKLIELVSSGWDNPRFYYNRIANDVQWQTNLELDVDRQVSDQTVPVIYSDNTPLDQRRDSLARVIEKTEQAVVNALSGQAVSIVQQQFIQFIDREVFAPLAFKHGQEWFGIGIESILSTRYAARILGVDPAPAIKAMSSDNPRNPIRMQTVDLLDPTLPQQLRPQAGPAYADALRRRSVSVVNDWLSRAGPDAIPKTLAAVKQQKPADGEALVKLIQQVTTIDLTPELRPK